MAPARRLSLARCHNEGQQMNVVGTPANTVILHWNECGTTWAQLPWRDWVRFRGFDDGGLSLLAGAEAGEHYFLVCVLDDRGELANVIPHRYVLSTDGRLVHGFDGLRQAEREEYCRIQLLLQPTIEDFGALQRARRPWICGQPTSGAHRAASAAGLAGARRRPAGRSMLALPVRHRNLALERAAQLARPRATSIRRAVTPCSAPPLPDATTTGGGG